MQRLSDTMIEAGIEALNKALGPVDAYRFMTLLHGERTDFVEISHRLYDGQSVDDIFARAKTRWND